MEGYYNAKTSQAGILSLNLKNGRYNLTQNQNRVFLNLNLISAFVRNLNLTEPNGLIQMDNPLNFASKISILKRYNLKLEEWSDSIQVIHYTQKTDSSLSGKFYIDSRNHTLMKVEVAKIFSGTSSFVTLNPNHTIRNLTIEATLLYNGESNQLNQLFGKVSYELFANGEKQGIATNYVLNFYEFGLNFETPFYGAERELMDYELISLMPHYNEIWQNEFTFKRTKAEENFFLYLNSPNTAVINKVKHLPTQIQNLEKECFINWRKLPTYSALTVYEYKQKENRFVNSKHLIPKMFDIKANLFCDFERKGDSTIFHVVPYIDYESSVFSIIPDSLNTASVNSLLAKTRKCANELEATLNNKYRNAEPKQEDVSKQLFFKKLELQRFQDSIYSVIYKQ